MIDLSIIFIFLIAIFIIQIIKMFEILKMILNLVIVTSLFSYITFTTTNVNISLMFGVLTLITFLLIPITVIIKYIEKLKK